MAIPAEGQRHQVPHQASHRLHAPVLRATHHPQRKLPVRCNLGIAQPASLSTLPQVLLDSFRRRLPRPQPERSRVGSLSHDPLKLPMGAQQPTPMPQRPENRESPETRMLCPDRERRTLRWKAPLLLLRHPGNQKFLMLRFASPHPN